MRCIRFGICFISSYSNGLKLDEEEKMVNTHKKIIEKYWKAANDRDWVIFESLLHEDIVYEIPQTRERIRGRAAFSEFNATYPGDWTLKIVRLVVDESQAVSQIVFRVNDEEQSGISFFEFKNGLIHRIVEFWPTPYDPPVRQSNSIEQY